MLYKVVLQKSEEGYSVSCPALPGCWSQGETEDDLCLKVSAFTPQPQLHAHRRF